MRPATSAATPNAASVVLNLFTVLSLLSIAKSLQFHLDMPMCSHDPDCVEMTWSLAKRLGTSVENRWGGRPADLLVTTVSDTCSGKRRLRVDIAMIRKHNPVVSLRRPSSIGRLPTGTATWPLVTTPPLQQSHQRLGGPRVATRESTGALSTSESGNARQPGASRAGRVNSQRLISGLRKRRALRHRAIWNPT